MLRFPDIVRVIRHGYMTGADARGFSRYDKDRRAGLCSGFHRMTRRANRAHVRNPVLALPAVAALRRLDPSTLAILRQLLLDLQANARMRAEASWHRRKPPMAAYWAAVAVYAGHFARALGSPAAADPLRPPRTVSRPEDGAKGRGRIAKSHCTEIRR